MNSLRPLLLLFICAVLAGIYLGRSSVAQVTQPHVNYEYLWYETENMRGITETSRHEPLLNPSYLNLPASKAPGWSISGPGVSAEWSQGGESEWNSVAASADAASGKIWQEFEVPRAGEYKVWVRYSDFANQTENFNVRIIEQGREVVRHEFGAQDIIDPHDEVSMYWGWAFAWDSAAVNLRERPGANFSRNRESRTGRRQVDCVTGNNDLSYVPEGRRKPDFAAMRYLRDWAGHARAAFAAYRGGGAKRCSAFLVAAKGMQVATS